MVWVGKIVSAVKDEVHKLRMELSAVEQRSTEKYASKSSVSQCWDAQRETEQRLARLEGRLEANGFVAGSADT